MAIKRVKRKINGTYQYCWTYDFYLDERRVRTPRNSYFPTRDECEAAAASIRADFRRGIYRFASDAPKIVIQEAIDDYIESLKNGDRSPRHIARAQNAFTRLGGIISLDKPITSITAKHLEKYLGERLKTVKKQTVYGDYMHLMGFMKKAKKNNKELSDWSIPDKPESVKRMRIGRTRIVSDDEEARILGELRKPLLGRENRYFHARSDTADIFEMALKTAMRIGEILKLKWSDVHLETDGGWLLVRGTKTAERGTGRTDDRFVPISEDLHLLLTRRLSQKTNDYVYPAVGSRSLRNGSRCMIHWSLKSACERANVLYGKFTEGGMVFHDTRHTAITRMLQAGGDLKTVMDIAGHKDISMTLAYTHSSVQSKTHAIKLLDRRVHLASAESHEPPQPDQPSPTGNDAQLSLFP